jgi:hypothetical protein
LKLVELAKGLVLLVPSALVVVAKFEVPMAAWT